MNVYGIIKELLLNYFITHKYQTLFISHVIKDEIRGENTRTISFSNQVQHTAYVTVLESFCILK